MRHHGTRGGPPWGSANGHWLTGVVGTRWLRLLRGGFTPELLLLCWGLGGEKPSLGTPGPVPHGRVCASAPQSPPLADLTVRAERPGTAAGESRVKEGTAGGRVTEESGRVSFGDFSLERRESAAAVGWS